MFRMCVDILQQCQSMNDYKYDQSSQPTTVLALTWLWTGIFPLEGMLLLIVEISSTSPAHWTSLGRIWEFWLSLTLEGVEATRSIQWPWAANNGHTHAYCYALAPCCTPAPFPPPLMDCFPHSPCLACAVASQDSRRPLGTALFSFSLTPNLQIVSNFTHKRPSFLDFQPYRVSCFVFTTADDTSLWG